MSHEIFVTPPDLKADAKAGRLSGDAAKINVENAARIEMLEHTTARLSLLSEALWHALQDKTGLEGAALADYVEAVAQQRKARSEQKLTCPACGHSSPAMKPACIYCGGKLEGAVSTPMFPA